MRQDWRIISSQGGIFEAHDVMIRTEDQYDRAYVSTFVEAFDRHASAIRAAAKGPGPVTTMRLRTAVALEDLAASIAALLPPDPPGAVTILLPAKTPEAKT